MPMTTADEIAEELADLPCVGYTALVSRGPQYPQSEGSGVAKDGDGWCVEFLTPPADDERTGVRVELPYEVLKICVEHDLDVQWNMDSEAWEAFPRTRE